MITIPGLLTRANGDRKERSASFDKNCQQRIVADRIMEIRLATAIIGIARLLVVPLRVFSPRMRGLVDPPKHAT